MENQPVPGSGSVCSAKHAGFLSTPLRRLFHNPEKMLCDLVTAGQTVVDLGCGPGFFTLPLAKLVGENGCVIAVDLQKEMLDLVMSRADREGLASRIRPHQCKPDALGVSGPVDFALAFYMVHEVPDVERFIREVAGIVKPKGRFLLVEPKFHVSGANFAQTVEIARAVGFALVTEPRIVLSRAALLQRNDSLDRSELDRNREAA
jgi:ubiquinone/menaquinone biosynthesis C-methylase UbiE